MRLTCWYCEKSVSNQVPDDTILRAVLVCPECIEAGRLEGAKAARDQGRAAGVIDPPPEER